MKKGATKAKPASAKARARATAKKPVATEPEPSTSETPEAPAKRKRGRRAGVEGIVRRNSLGPALGDAEKCKQVIHWYFAEGLSRPACVKKIEETFGIKTAVHALEYFTDQYSFFWRVEQAKEQANLEKDKLPADWEGKTRQALAQRKFVAVFDELTNQELVAFEKIELEKKKIQLRAAHLYLNERRQVLAERKAEVLEDSTAAAATAPAISPEEEEHRIQSILGKE